MAAECPAKNDGSVATCQFLFANREQGRMKHTLNFLNPVTLDSRITKTFLLCDKSTLEHQHDAIKQTVHNLKSGTLTIPTSSKTTFIPALALARLILDSHIADLKDLHGNTVVFVLTNSLE
jgi:hypothetical protein